MAVSKTKIKPDSMFKKKSNDVMEFEEKEMRRLSGEKLKQNQYSNNKNVEEGDNTKFLKHSLSMWNLPVLDIRDSKAVEDRLEWYFTKCMEDDVKPTMSGLSLALGVSRQTIINWANGTHRGESHLEVVKKAYRLMAVLNEEYITNNKGNPIGNIFLAKNNFGYSDKTEITVSANTTVDNVNVEEIKQKYLEQQEQLQLETEYKE